MKSAETEARRSLNRLRRALEKAVLELGALQGALERAEGDDFPRAEYDRVSEALKRLRHFTDEEGGRLQEKLLHSGGLEPGRVRRG